MRTKGGPMKRDKIKYDDLNAIARHLYETVIQVQRELSAGA
jgi:hypothetical protein